MADEYAAYIEERYQGEVFGEAFMRAMAEVRTDPNEVRKFRALEQLERETKEMLRPAVEESGRSTEPNQQKIEQAEAIGAQLGQATWSDILRGMRPELAKFVDDFRAAESLAPAGKDALLRQVTAHEQALLDFVDHELAEKADSLSSVRALLRDASPD